MTMKTKLLIALAMYTTAAMAQQTVRLDNGVALLDGKEWLYVQETKIDKTTMYEVVKNATGDVIAQLTFKNNGDKVYFKGEFRKVSRRYETNYPANTGIQTVLESYNKNKVIVDSKIDLPGLQLYCDSRQIPLVIVLSAEEQMAADVVAKKQYEAYKAEQDKKKATTDATNKSTSSAQAGAKYVSFTLENHSSKSIRFFIGKEVKYGSGSYNNTGGNTISSEHGYVGEKFCIVDDHDNPISCTTITDGMGKVEINSSGTGFGN